METIHVYYDGRVFVPLDPIDVIKNQSIIITVSECKKSEADNSQHDELFGALAYEDYLEIAEALKDTERVDYDEW